MGDSLNRILLKLSGEALAAGALHGIDSARLAQYAGQIKTLVDNGTQVGIVVGGGNIFRGVSGEKLGIDRVTGDYMGMLATVINGLAIQSALVQLGAKAIVFTATDMEPVGMRYSKPKALDALQNQTVAIFTFGTGNPYFTTDTAAVLRAVEIEADALLKGTRVDGVYSADPETTPDAVKYDTLTFDEAYTKQLKIMDLTAFTMCWENNLPVVVFNMNIPNNLESIVKGEQIGTLISN
jgi:uridylate kinase